MSHRAFKVGPWLVAFDSGGTFAEELPQVQFNAWQWTDAEGRTVTDVHGYVRRNLRGRFARVRIVRLDQ